MAITYSTSEVKMPVLKKRKINRWIQEVARSYDRKTGEIAYLFCSDEVILDTNRKYLHHDYYTDIITFDYTEKNILHGDIFISLDTVKSNASLFGVSFDDELHRVLIHGILHLCGIEDKGEENQRHMTSCENRALALLKNMPD